jgi:hypothetical protein
LRELYSNPQLLAANPHFSSIEKALRNGMVALPSMAPAKRFPEVSRAYSSAVHAVLTGKKSGATAAADLEKELADMTGLEPPATKAPLSRAQDGAAVRQ